MKLIHIPAICLTVLSISAALGAEEQTTEPQAIEVVVSATRHATPLEKVPSAVTVITGDEIEARQERQVSQALRSVPGADVVQSGTFGGNSAVLLRGANPEHTLVLIDGVEANNPISPGRVFNFSGFSSDDIERIEVLRGPQSTLYGSDALGGVINIISRRGEGPVAGFASAEAGSFDTYIERAGISGGGKAGSYSLGASRTDIGGISAADSEFGNKEKDAQGISSIAGNVTASLSDDLEARLVARYIDERVELDNMGGAFGDDPNRVLENEEFFGRAELHAGWFEDELQQTLGFSYASTTFDDNNDPDESHPGETLRSRYEGVLQKADLQNIWAPRPDFHFTLGFESEEESGNSRYQSMSAYGPYEDNFTERSATNNAYYAQAEVDWLERFYTVSGVRLDQHSKFGAELTWRAGQTVQFKETGTKLSGTVASGFKAPSLFQLYSSYGNQDLEAEKSVGFDLSLEQTLLPKVQAGITYFHNRFRDLVIFDPGTFLYENSARASTGGVEIFSRYTLCDYLSGGLSYTYTDSRDRELDQPLLRRARNKAALDLTAKLNDRASITALLLFVGRRFDNNYGAYPPVRETLGSYTLVNLSGEYRLTEKVALFARVENLFERDYEEVFGYGTPGIGAYGGIKLQM